MNWYFQTFICLFPGIICATEFAPWLDKDFEFQPRMTVLHQSYHSIATSSRSIHHASYDRFYTGSIGLSAFDWSGEVETTLADTSHQRGACDNIRLTARYRWLSDIIDDPFTVTTGITATQAFRHSVRDISSFHHGQLAGEAHIAIGKETAYQSFWQSRWWTVVGVGIADQGYPWIRFNASWEKNLCIQHQFRLFLHSLYGLGHHNLHSSHHFRGYGPIRHRSIDVGMRYSYEFVSAGNLSIEYARRIFAENFPSQTNLFLLSYLYPFSL